MPYATVPLSYIYLPKQTQDRYELMLNATSWPKRLILTQISHCFGKRFLDYYREVADIDAIARGFQQHQGEHFKLLREWGQLPPYINGRPDYGRSPLDDMATVNTGLKRHSFNGFKCSARNAVVFKLACVVERESPQIVMSKLATWYYENYWSSNYIEQIESSVQKTLSPDMSKAIQIWTVGYTAANTAASLSTP